MLRAIGAALEARPQPLESALCLVRIAHLPEMSELMGYAAVGVLLDAFEARVRELARSRDVVVPLERKKVALVLNGVVSREHLTLAAAKLERVFAPLVDVHGDWVKLRVNAGLVALNAGNDADRVLRQAEAALRRARERGSVCEIVDADLALDPVDLHCQREIETSLSAGEFQLYYQPKLAARTGDIAGAEALLRWHSSRRGLVMPGDFIPAAERSNVIRNLTWFAIKSAVAECRNWPGGHVSVNVPPTLLNNPEILQVVSDALAIFDVPAERFMIEVTETAFMQDRVRAFEVLTGLRRIGSRVSIDDFGTGYSSFAQFRDLPADEIKVDRSFVEHMRRSPGDEVLVKGIIDLAHHFGLDVVAEGVQDAATAEQLHDLGCDLMQGYWIGKPMPAPRYDAWLRERTTQSKA